MNKLVGRPFLCLLMMLLMPASMSAKTYMGKITIKVGEEYYVEAVPTSGYTASGYWDKSNSHFVIAASGDYSCKIRGNTVGSGTLSYWGVIYRTGSWTTEQWEKYWDVEVISDPNPDPNPDPDPNSPDNPDEPTEKWSDKGNYSISWYNKDLNEYTISTNKELAGMAYLVNNGYTNFDGKTIKLSEDIDLSGKKWTPCGKFYGIFDGQGHTISDVYIKSEDACGFWTYTKGIIKNLTLEGLLYGSTSRHYDYGVGFGKAGGFAAESWNCSFVNCHSRITIVCSGDFGYIGGVVGEVGNSVKLSYCTFKGDINCTTPHAISIGGLASTANGITLEYCEARIPSISVATNRGYGVAKSSDVVVCGICPSGTSSYCSSCIESIDVNVKWPTVDEVDIRGIGTWRNCINSYSVISKVSTNSSKFTYSGIANKVDKKDIANFSNNDVSGVESATKGNCGSTNFSSEQMKTDDFLEELNMYSFLEEGNTVWTLGEDGFPCIKQNWQQTTDIYNIVIEESIYTPIYTLSGQRLAIPQKGINIIGGKKVIVK